MGGELARRVEPLLAQRTHEVIKVHTPSCVTAMAGSTTVRTRHVIQFTVLGTAVTQGSKHGFYNQHTGRVQMVEGKGDNPQRHKSWREAVRAEAQDTAESVLCDGPMIGRVAVHLQFRLQRPASAPKKRRTWPIGARSGDVDKLARSVLDSLTGVLFVDDSQVTELVVTKDYGTPGVTIEVYSADELDGQLEVVS